jgi:hypothetical protein
MNHILFDLEAFKQGRPAVEIKTGFHVFFRFELTDDIINFEYEDGLVSERFVSEMTRDFSMLSVHNKTMRKYLPGQSWQVKTPGDDKWTDLIDWTDPKWDETKVYRLHPHNAHIRMYLDGVKEWEEKCDGEYRTVTNPKWKEDCTYRPRLRDIKVTEHIVQTLTGDVISVWLKDDEVLNKDYKLIAKSSREIVVPNY